MGTDWGYAWDRLGYDGNWLLADLVFLAFLATSPTCYRMRLDKDPTV